MTEPEETRNPWQTLSSQQHYDNPWICVHEHQVINPAGKPGIYGTVHFKNRAVGILPITETGDTYLVGQYRYALSRYSWEIPEGGGDHDEAPVAAAKRELREEVGLHAEHWQPILSMVLSNSVTDEQAISFLAWTLSQGTAEPDESEELVIKRLPLQAAMAMVDSGEITDAISVATLLKCAHLARTGRLPAAVQAIISQHTSLLD